MQTSASTSVLAVLERAAGLRPEAGLTFVDEAADPGRHWSYPRLCARAREIAVALGDGYGVRKGERVALALSSPEEFVLALFGALYAGAVPVPLYAPLQVGRQDSYLEHCQHIVRTSRSALLVTTPQLQPHADDVRSTAPDLRSVLTFAELGGADEAGYRAPSLAPDDLALIQFTSGSTSHPKGVMLSHANLLANSVAIMTEGLHSNGDDQGVSWLPLYHDMGLIGFVIAPLVTQVPVTLIPTSLFLRRPSVWLQVLSRHRGTITYAPNFAYGLAARRVRDADIDGIDLSSVRVAGCGAEPIQAETLRAFARRYEPYGFQEDAFVPSYGMAESSLAISFGAGVQTERVRAKGLMERGHAELISGDEATSGELTIELVCCGAPFSGHAVRILDAETGERLGPRRVGEVVLSGPSVMQGYFEAPQSTLEAIDGDGWLHTGDLGYLDERGRIYVCGRLKDLIIVNGRNYYPQDLEWAAANVDGVRLGNLAAFAASWPGLDREAVIVVAESKWSRDEEKSRTLAWAISREVEHAIGLPVDEVIVAAPRTIPKTSSGKVQRAKVRALYSSGALHAQRVEAKSGSAVAERNGSQTEMQAYLRRVLAELLGVSEARVDVHEDVMRLGLDSLGLVRFRHAVERELGLIIPAERFFEAASIAQLAVEARATRGEQVSSFRARLAPEPPAWFYRRGARLRFLDRPLDLLYRLCAERTIVLGREGLQEPPPRAVLVSSHRSHLDFCAIRAALRATPARHYLNGLVTVASSERLARHSGSGAWALVIGLGLYPLRESGDAEATIQALARAVGSNSSILLHPQGSHSRFEREQAGDPAEDFRPGVALLSAVLQIPVVPCGIAGTEQLVPPRVPPGFRGPVVGGVALQFRRAPVAVVFGPPMRASKEESPEAFTARLQARCFELNCTAESARLHQGRTEWPG